MQIPFRANLDFRVVPLVCTEPDCPCRQFHLEFHATPTGEDSLPPDREDRAECSVTLDLDSWHEVARKTPSELHDRIVDQYLAELDAPSRQILGDMVRAIRRKQKLVRGFETHRFSPALLASGDLVSYTELCHEIAPLAGNGVAMSFGADYGNRRIVADDHYCPQPSCDCRESVLSVFECHDLRGDDEAAGLTHLFGVRMNLDGGYELILPPDADTPRDAATEMVEALRAEHVDFVAKLRERYRTIKKIGKRSIPQPSPPPTAPRPKHATTQTRRRAARPGRNAPCPCGSGKKFKHCCGL